MKLIRRHIFEVLLIPLVAVLILLLSSSPKGSLKKITPEEAAVLAANRIEERPEGILVEGQHHRILLTKGNSSGHLVGI